MKKSIIGQWVAGGILALLALTSGFSFSTIIFALAAVLAMPIQPIRKKLAEFKIQNWAIVIVTVFLFIAGCMAMPSSQIEQDPANTDLVTENITETTDDVKEASSEPEDGSANANVNSETEDTEQKADDSNTENTLETLNLTSVPEYSGKAYVAINGNDPTFSTAELTTTSYEKYSSLDKLGRCGTAIASVGKDIMPTEERGSIGDVKPTGWHTVKYDNIDGKYLYNRCHLIGYQLTGENANTKNLITGTRYLNIEGMLPFENMVADYVEETGNHVAYRVTPIFEGNNLVASGVQMEGYSVEDNGDGICFNVYCYNVQPGITINYATGESSLEDSSKVTPSSDSNSNETNKNTASNTRDDTNSNSNVASGSNDDNSNNTDKTEPSAGNTASNEGNTSQTTETKHETNPSTSTIETMVWIPQNGKKYHSKSSCSNMKSPSQVTKSYAESNGYTACKKCY